MDDTRTQTTAEPDCVLPNKDVQKFLLDVINQSNFPGHLSESVSYVKQLLSQASLKS